MFICIFVGVINGGFFLFGLLKNFLMYFFEGVLDNIFVILINICENIYWDRDW